MAGTTQYYGISYPTNTDYVKDGATAMQTIADGFDSAVAIPTYNNQTGTSYTFVLTDAGKTVTSNNASAVTFTIPPQASVAWANNTTLTVRNLGAGVVTIAGGAGVTVTNTAQTVAQYGAVRIIRTASNAWTVLPASGAPSALTYIGGSTFSAQSSISYNNVFSSTYSNYFITFNGNASTSSDLAIRVRASGTDFSGASGYPYTGIERAGAGFFTYAGSDTKLVLGPARPTRTSFSLNIFDPQNSTVTFMTSNFMYLNSGVNHGNFLAGGGVDNTNSYDGFTIFPASGTLTGTIRIYGISNS